MEAPLPAADEEQEARRSRVLSKRVKSCTFAKCNRLLLHPEITRLLPLPPSAFTLPRMHFRHVHYQDTTNRKRTYLSLISPCSLFFLLRPSRFAQVRMCSSRGPLSVSPSPRYHSCLAHVFLDPFRHVKQLPPSAARSASQPMAATFVLFYNIARYRVVHISVAAVMLPLH